ncbi:MAG TPA: DUF2817 domain-containing protein, partial [Candidatus Saccharimonadales bacterium]|nr:DUF2817 domain-containing protein [Candidatus Saccharimonadales bacterium]
MSKGRQTLRHLLKKIQRLPLEATIPIAVFVFVGIFYALAFFVEKQVSFSYAGTTCVRQLTFLPGIHKISGQSNYVVRASDKLSFGGVTFAAFSLCFTPKEIPRPGDMKVSTAPWGGWFARKTFNLKVEQPVVAYINKLTKPVPVSRPLTIELSGTDRVFSYKLKVGEKRTSCRPLEAKLSCTMKELNVIQGHSYPVELERYFNGKKVSSVAKKKLSILSATRVTDASIKTGETVYMRPKTIDVTFDKKIIKATPVLYRIEGDRRTKVTATTKVTNMGVHIVLVEELPRSADYELVTSDVIASDGSSLEEPYRLPFKTSGGPRVTGVNVGGVSVPMGITVVVSFDQPLSEKQDISKFVSTTGGATVTGKQGNQLLVSLSKVPKCGDFGIKITNDLQSNYEIAGNSAWSFAGRTICHTIGTVGYSHQGRAINAYYFGNGARTVLYTGAIHGNEYGTKGLMERWIRELEVNARKIPVDKQVVVVPAINPDGIAAGTRTNARNVDLNRNFATSDWRTDITDVSNRPFPGGGGPSPMSEPETAAIASLAQRLRPQVILSYHSIGAVV